MKGLRETVEEALRALRLGMEADGYLLQVQELNGDQLTIRIEATANACKECLVPKEVMRGIIQTSLPAPLGINNVSLVYPAECASSDGVG